MTKTLAQVELGHHPLTKCLNSPGFHCFRSSSIVLKLIALRSSSPTELSSHQAETEVKGGSSGQFRAMRGHREGHQPQPISRAGEITAGFTQLSVTDGLQGKHYMQPGIS